MGVNGEESGRDYPSYLNFKKRHAYKFMSSDVVASYHSSCRVTLPAAAAAAAALLVRSVSVLGAF